MDTLRLVEVAGDGALVLMTGDGRRFSLAVDEQVRSAVRRSRNGTQESTVPDRPGPREVQSRIRAGADAEQVAAQTGLDVDYVRRFEGPVLAERAHVADLARATAVDRGDPTLNLERVVLDVLTGEGYDVDDISWDSRRSDGSRWQVVATSRAGSVRTEATWSFDTSTRSLEPVDAEAERLTGVERRRRLSAVRDTVFDVERPAAAAVRGGTVELLDALARQRGRRPLAAPRAQEPDGGTGSSDDEDGAASRHQSAGTHEARPDGAGPDGGWPDGARPDESGTDQAAPDQTGQDQAAPHAADQAGPDATGRDLTGRDAGDPDVTGSDATDRDATDGDVTDHPVHVVATRARPGHGQDEVSIEPDLLSELRLDTRPTAGRPALPDPGRQRPVAHSPVTPSAVTAAERRSRRRRAAVPSWDEIVFGAKREGSS